jgi:hypothetical protein
MWINRDVDLPQALVAAQREGRLVIFAGAGVSMGPPANLPSFEPATRPQHCRPGDRRQVVQLSPGEPPASREVPFRKCTPRSGLQILLEASSILFGRELQDDDHRPGPMIHRLAARSVVVPFQSILDITRDADVVPFRTAVAAEDVDEALVAHTADDA